MKIHGVAHIQLNVTDLERSKAFYAPLLARFGMTVLVDDADAFYCVGGRTGLAITPCDEAHRDDRFDDLAIGLQHVCFRMESREAIDETHRLVEGLGAEIVYPPRPGPWAPGYYSCSFRDPDGIRLEVNFVPGKGNLDPSIELPLRKTDIARSEHADNRWNP